MVLTADDSSEATLFRKYHQISVRHNKKPTRAQPVMNEQRPEASWEGKGDE